MENQPDNLAVAAASTPLLIDTVESHEGNMMPHTASEIPNTSSSEQDISFNKITSCLTAEASPVDYQNSLQNANENELDILGPNNTEAEDQVADESGLLDNQLLNSYVLMDMALPPVSSGFINMKTHDSFVLGSSSNNDSFPLGDQEAQVPNSLSDQACPSDPYTSLFEREEEDFPFIYDNQNFDLTLPADDEFYMLHKYRTMIYHYDDINSEYLSLNSNSSIQNKQHQDDDINGFDFFRSTAYFPVTSNLAQDPSPFAHAVLPRSNISQNTPSSGSDLSKTSQFLNSDYSQTTLMNPKEDAPMPASYDQSSLGGSVDEQNNQKFCPSSSKLGGLNTLELPKTEMVLSLEDETSSKLEGNRTIYPVCCICEKVCSSTDALREHMSLHSREEMIVQLLKILNDIDINIINSISPQLASVLKEYNSSPTQETPTMNENWEDQNRENKRKFSQDSPLNSDELGNPPPVQRMAYLDVDGYANRKGSSRKIIKLDKEAPMEGSGTKQGGPLS